MKTLLLGVPNSGNHFMLHFLIGTLGLDCRYDIADLTAESGGDFSYLHSMPDTDFTIPALFDTLIVPQRHPYKSVTNKRKFTTEEIVFCWRCLIKDVEKYSNIFFVTIDGTEENRFPQLMAIANHFNMGHREDRVREYADAWIPKNANRYKADEIKEDTTVSDEDVVALAFAVVEYEKWLK